MLASSDVPTNQCCVSVRCAFSQQQNQLPVVYEGCQRTVKIQYSSSNVYYRWSGFQMCRNAPGSLSPPLPIPPAVRVRRRAGLGAASAPGPHVRHIKFTIGLGLSNPRLRIQERCKRGQRGKRCKRRMRGKQSALAAARRRRQAATVSAACRGSAWPAAGSCCTVALRSASSVAS